jgi:hypothetical protein
LTGKTCTVFPGGYEYAPDYDQGYAGGNEVVYCQQRLRSDDPGSGTMWVSTACAIRAMMVGGATLGTAARTGQLKDEGPPVGGPHILWTGTVLDRRTD